MWEFLKSDYAFNEKNDNSEKEAGLLFWILRMITISHCQRPKEATLGENPK